MKYVITNAGNPTAGSPLWVTGRQANGRAAVRGVCETSALEFDTAEQAEDYMLTLNPHCIRFYKLAAKPAHTGRRPGYSHAWMFRHSGYDLMH